MIDQAREIIVEPGDTLWAIARRELGDVGRWREIYQLNEPAISAAQAQPARRLMRGPDWIFPGTKLQIPTTRRT